MPRQPLLAKPPENCPACGEPLRCGFSTKHSLGPGPEGRFIAALALPLGVLAALAVARFINFRFALGHAIFGTGLAVAFLVYKAADTSQKPIRIRCRLCKWHGEALHQ